MNKPVLAQSKAITIFIVFALGYFISTGNIGCITQISHGTKVPILHTIEVLDWYTGGPKPQVLQRN